LAFGWSFAKLLVFLTMGFLLLGVPMGALLVALRERRRKEHHDE
jgi:hypothetical protein